MIEFSAAKTRTVLAMLLLARSRVVSDSRLAAMLWGEDPPATADAQIQNYVSRLRRKLGTVQIVRQRPGYLLSILPEQLDLAEFERLAAEGREALLAGRIEEASVALKSALATWHGPALAGVTRFLADVERPRLEEARLATLGDRIDVDLAQGMHIGLATELTGLVADDPLREQLRGQFMVALYRSSRQAEALATYENYRLMLAEELGIDPGRDLQDLRQAVLVADPTLDLIAITDVVHIRPALLPPDITDFTGRVREVEQVIALLRPVDDDGLRVACVIAGMAGVGKTALAVHAAQRLRDLYPDGQIYVDLCGAGSSPAEPTDILRLILRALGTDVASVPAAFDERVQLYRRLLSGRRLLILLDNAANEQQVRPLLPDSAGCAALITARMRLTALEGVPLVDLDVLAEPQAQELLARIAGPARVAAEPEAAQQIVRLCGHLPLGVRIAGARLAAKPYWRLARLAERLDSQRRRLDELCIADLEVRSSIALSIQGLDQAHRRAFRLLALLAMPRFATWTAAVVLDVTVAEARELVEGLVDSRLLEAEGVAGTYQIRYFFHDLVRVVALELAAEEETAAERSAALERALGTSPVLPEQDR